MCTEFLVGTGLGSSLFGFALDPVNETIYFTRAGSVATVNYDGTRLQTLISDDIVGPNDIAIDYVNRQSYITDGNVDEVKRANMDGTKVRDIVTGLGTPIAIAVHPVAGKVYWSDSITGRVQQADLDGSNVSDLVIGGMTEPHFIILGPRP